MGSTTTNYSLYLPTPNSPFDANTWGNSLNNMAITPLDTNLFNTAVQNIGNTAPVLPLSGANPSAGQTWINNSDPAAWIINIYDGAEWVNTGTLNSVTHTFSANVGMIINVQVFTTSRTYTPSANLQFAIGECFGAGGGGGAALALSGTSTAGGAGGGSGGAGRKTLTPAQIGAGLPITIGSGGNGSTGTNNAGTGGTSSISTFLICTGGTGGNDANNQGSSFSGNAGSASGIDIITLFTSNGLPGLATSSAVINGGGGSNYAAGGGKATGASGGTVINSNGGNGALGGGGGAGAIILNYSTTRSGGNGGNGLVVIYEYIISG